MAKHNLVKDITAATGIIQTDVELVLNATIELIRERVSQGKEVHLNGFGIFKTRIRPPKIARNLKGKGNKRKNPEPIHLPAKRVPHFKPSKKFLTQ
jgi:integration host factor subunit beta